MARAPGGMRRSAVVGLRPWAVRPTAHAPQGSRRGHATARGRTNARPKARFSRYGPASHGVWVSGCFPAKRKEKSAPRGLPMGLRPSRPNATPPSARPCPIPPARGGQGNFKNTRRWCVTRPPQGVALGQAVCNTACPQGAVGRASARPQVAVGRASARPLGEGKVKPHDFRSCGVLGSV